MISEYTTPLNKLPENKLQCRYSVIVLQCFVYIFTYVTRQNDCAFIETHIAQGMS